MIQANWENTKTAIERGVDLANYFGIDRDNLTSANALIPLIYYLSKRPDLTLRGTTPFEAKNASNARQWLVMALLNGVFGGTSDNMLRDIRSELQKHPAPEHDLPVAEMNDVIKKAGRKATFDEYSIDDVLSLTYGRRSTFLALSLLYDEAGWGTMTFHQDHIFPSSLFKWKDLVENGHTSWSGLGDRLGNLTLLWSRENEEKSNQPFDQWLKTRDSSFKKRHFIPDDPALWKFDKFEAFLSAREELIKKRLATLLA
jgi:hypothetical protein